jgi:hypothetical protein
MTFLGDLERFIAENLYPNRVPIGTGLAIVMVVVVIVAWRRGWFAAARRHPRRTGLVIALALAIGLPGGWYLGSPLFIRTSLNEPAPTAAAPSAPPVAPDATPGSDLAAPRSGTFAGADEFHFGSGTATLIETAPGTWTVRFENFSVRNGPDLFVYVSPDPAGYDDAGIDLGRLKATDGNFNMDLPAGSDPGGAASIVIWCKQFAVQFAVAPLEG